MDQLAHLRSPRTDPPLPPGDPFTCLREPQVRSAKDGRKRNDRILRRVMLTNGMAHSRTALGSAFDRRPRKATCSVPDAIEGER